MSAELIKKLVVLDGGDLGNAPPFPDINNILKNINFVRIHRLSKFWGNDKYTSFYKLFQNTFSLTCSFHSLEKPLIFALRGTNSNIECWFGSPLSKSDFKSMLLSAYPDVRFGGISSFINNRVNFRLASMAMGIPEYPQENTSDIPEQIENLCRGMYGDNWEYLIVANPINMATTRGSRNTIINEIQTTQQKYIIKNSISDDRNRLAEFYIDSLEKSFERYQQGISVGMWDTQAYLFTDKATNLAKANGCLVSAFAGESSFPEFFRTQKCQPSSSTILKTSPLTSLEVATMIRPPSESYPGYELVDYTRFGLEAPLVAKGKTAINFGEIIDRGRDTGNSLEIPTNDITKHLLIAGVTGSGKTNTCFYILEKLSIKNIPFLVIESAKTEYRDLLSMRQFSKVQIFTPSNETLSPFRINPFEVPSGILVQTHIDYLKSLFSAAFVLYPPMPYVLEQSIQEVYEEHGWNLSLNTNSRGGNSIRSNPTLTDLAIKIPQVVDSLGYDSRIAMDVSAGLLARINQLRQGGGKGPMLDTQHSISSSDLFEKSTILELKHIVSDDEKAFIIGLLLVRLYEHRELQGNSNGVLRHFTLIEEAHRLLKNISTEQGGESANPQGKAIEVFSNILSEIRAYGEGLGIAEQIPTKLTPDAIKNTNLKVVHRIVAEDDRNAVGSTMTLSDEQREFISTLETGKVVAYSEGMQAPVLLQVPLAKAKVGTKHVSDSSLRSHMKSYWSSNIHTLVPNISCRLCSHTNKRICRSSKLNYIPDYIYNSVIRLFNSFRLGRYIKPALDVFIRYCRSTYPNTSIYCIYSKTTEVYIEKNAEIYDWNFDIVDEILTKNALVMKATETQSFLTNKSFIAKQKDFSTYLEQLHSSHLGQYPACSVCKDSCMFMHDMRPLDENKIGDFQYFCSMYDESNNKSEYFDKIKNICNNRSNLYYHPSDNIYLKKSSLCCLVILLDETGYTPSQQVNMAKAIINY